MNGWAGMTRRAGTTFNDRDLTEHYIVSAPTILPAFDRCLSAPLQKAVSFLTFCPPHHLLSYIEYYLIHNGIVHLHRYPPRNFTILPNIPNLPILSRSFLDLFCLPSYLRSIFDVYHD